MQQINKMSFDHIQVLFSGDRSKKVWGNSFAENIGAKKTTIQEFSQDLYKKGFGVTIESLEFHVGNERVMINEDLRTVAQRYQQTKLSIIVSKATTTTSPTKPSSGSVSVTTGSFSVGGLTNISSSANVKPHSNNSSQSGEMMVRF